MRILENRNMLKQEAANLTIAQTQNTAQPRAQSIIPVETTPVANIEQAIQDSQSYQESVQNNNNTAIVPVSTNQPSSSAVLEAQLAEDTERAANLRRHQEGQNRRDLLPTNSQINQQGERVSHTGTVDLNAPNVNQTKE